jgi:hypothetical protein
MTCSTSVAAAGRVHPNKVVPRAARADLDDVTGDLVGSPAKPRQLLRARRATPVRGESRAEHVGDVDHRSLFTDGTVLSQRHTYVSRCSQELGVGVTDLEAGEPTLAELSHHRVASQAVLDATAGTADREAPQSRRPETHPNQGTAGPEVQAPTQRDAGLAGRGRQRPHDWSQAVLEEPISAVPEQTLGNDLLVTPRHFVAP